MSVLDAEAAARFSTAAALDARDQLAIPASGGLLTVCSLASLAFVCGVAACCSIWLAVALDAREQLAIPPQVGC